MTTLPILCRAPTWLDDPIGAADDAAPAPVLWNLRGMAQGWTDFPLSMDFLDPRSPNHGWKCLQTFLYSRVAHGALTPRPSLRVLDAACGIGRFAVPFARAGAQVTAIDACLPSLQAAARHGADLGDRLQLIHADLHDLDVVLGEGTFDLVVVMELLCYLPDPLPVTRALARHLRPGGTLVMSVEAWPGALLSDPSGLGEVDLTEVLSSRTLSVPGDRWVRASDRQEAGAILKTAGLELVSIVGTHYLPDGPLSALLDPDRAGQPREQARVGELEDTLRADPNFSALPRAWLAVARAPR